MYLEAYKAELESRLKWERGLERHQAQRYASDERPRLVLRSQEPLALAAAILERAERPKPLHPFIVARLVGIHLKPAFGLAAPAELDGALLYFDEWHDGWREAVGTLVCGFALREHGLNDSPEARRELAQALGTPITESGEVEASPTSSDQPVLH